MSGRPVGVGGDRVRLLVVAYYFPPSGGAGVQRIVKWVKYLPEHGVDPVVLTVSDGAYPERDYTLLDEVPDGIEVVRVGGFDPFTTYARMVGASREDILSARTDDVGASPRLTERLARWIRANVFIPDARVGWVPSAVLRGRKLIQSRSFAAVLSSGPPHSVHLAASRISRTGHLPWVADFRDPWTDIHYYDRLPRTSLSKGLDAHLERSVLRRADSVITVSPSWAALLAKRSSRHVITLPNGFDPADFEGPPPERDPNTFILAHVGSLFGTRNPVALWRALESLRNRGVAQSLRFQIVGRVADEVLRVAHRSGIDIEVRGYVDHRAAVNAMREADALLLSTEPQPAEAGHIPGKLFEYLATGTPVLGLGDPMGDAARILEDTGGGTMFDRDDVKGVERTIADWYARWANGEAFRGAPASAVERYSRRRQAAELAAHVRRTVVTSSA